MTAYLGAGPIVKALEMGADVVVTGRTADSALALAPCVHEFGWKLCSERRPDDDDPLDPADLDKLAAGSLAGHLIECGGQATGGLFTDWELVPGYENLGFPVVDVDGTSGDIVVRKPPGTGGLLNRFTVAEQLLYEIGDPRSYVLPDVVCDFADVRISDTPEQGRDEAAGVRVTGSRGKPPTDSYKVCATYLDGFRANCAAIVVGGDSAGKAHKVGKALMDRARGLLAQRGLAPFTKHHVSVLGAEDGFGPTGSGPPRPREAVLWMGVQHPDRGAIDLWAREIASAGTGMAPGMCGMVGGRPKATPCLKLFSFLYPKTLVPVVVRMDDDVQAVVVGATSSCHGSNENDVTKERHHHDPDVVEACESSDGATGMKLGRLAYARSGDKGNDCNVGVIARHPAFLPYIKRHVTPTSVAHYFSRLFDDESSGSVVEAYDLPGIDAINFVLRDSLDGGGMASLRPDPLGKSVAQMLLDFELHGIPEPEEIIRRHEERLKDCK